MIALIIAQSEILYNIQIISTYDKNKEIYLRSTSLINKAQIDRKVYYRIDTTVNDLSNLDILIYDKRSKTEKIIPIPKFLEPKSLEVALGESLNVAFDFLGFPISEFDAPRVYIISDQGESESFLLQQDPYKMNVLTRQLDPIDEIGNYKLALVINHTKQMLEIRIYRPLNVVYKPVYSFYSKSYGFSNQPAYFCLEIYNKLPNTVSEDYNVIITDPKGIPISLRLRNYGDYSCGIALLSDAGLYKAKLEGEYKAVIGYKTVEFKIEDSLSFEIPIKLVGIETKKNKGFIWLENTANKPISLTLEDVQAPPEIQFNLSGDYPISQNTKIPFTYKFLKKVKKNSNLFIRLKFKDSENNFYFLDIKLSVF